MSIGTYLYFQGNCREAIEFYEDAFKTEKARILTYGDIPNNGGEELPETVKNLILHASMRIAGDEIKMSDASPDSVITIGNNVGIIASLETAGMVQSYFDKLKVGGEVIMEVQETFFSKCYAYLIDKFGVSWQLYVDSHKD